MINESLIDILNDQVDNLRFFQQHLRESPKEQAPDCTKLFQAMINLNHEITKMKNNTTN